MTEEVIFLYGCIAAITFVAGIVHGAIGFGFGIVALATLACLPTLMDADAAHVMMSVCSLPMLLTAAWSYRHGIDWQSLRPAVLGAALLMPVGLFAFVSMPLDWLVRGTGLAIILMTLLSLRNQSVDVEQTQAGTSVASFVAGSISGLLGGAVSIAGPPVATFALHQGWAGDRFKAFVTQCLLVVCCYKVAGLFISEWISQDGLVTGDRLMHAAWATPFSILGIRAGVHVGRFIDPKSFQYIVAAALLVVGGWLMYRGQPPPQTEAPSAAAEWLQPVTL